MSITKRPKARLTLEQVVAEIKGLVKDSALAKIEIGELLNKYTSDIPHGGKADFYKSIGMTVRTAQYYMKIASNEEVQKLKRENKLEGLNMQEILHLVGARVNIRGVNNDNAPQAEQTYTPLGFGSFDFEKCRSTKKFKLEYEELSNKVSELEKELAELRPVTKRA